MSLLSDSRKVTAFEELQGCLATTLDRAKALKCLRDKVNKGNQKKVAFIDPQAALLSQGVNAADQQLEALKCKAKMLIREMFHLQVSCTEKQFGTKSAIIWHITMKHNQCCSSSCLI